MPGTAEKCHVLTAVDTDRRPGAGVSVYYEAFTQVTDADVASLLHAPAPALR